MQVDNRMEAGNTLLTPRSLLSKRNREATFVTSSVQKSPSSIKLNPYEETTVFRTKKFPDNLEDQQTNINNKLQRSYTTINKNERSPLNRPQIRSGRRSTDNFCKCKEDNNGGLILGEENFNSSRIKTPSSNNYQNQLNNGNRKSNEVYWSNLDDKIQDWFEYARTPDQRVVYRFLKDLKEDDFDKDSSSWDQRSESNVSDKAQSLEDILNNLKKYRRKFNRKGAKSAAISVGDQENSLQDFKPDATKSNDNLNRLFESSTWRVMRHLKSADIKNKYPLPKANPDYHFRNATIFHTAGRAPKSTFLLHPDWV